MPPRQLERDDLDLNYEYPVDLFEQAASGDTWISPTKAVKEYHRPLKRRKASKRGPRTKSDVLPTLEAQSSQDLATDDVDAGIWDSMSMDPISSPAFIQPSSPVSAERDPDANLADYIEAVETFGAGWYCINESLFVVQGWDARRTKPTNIWYHLQHLEIENEVHVACTCPRHSQHPSCIHEEFFNMYDVDSLLSMTALIEAPGNANVAIYFRQQLPNSPDFLTMFSVKGVSTSELKGRAIVSHTGVSPSGGTWKCSKHSSGLLCVHVRDAFELFQSVIGEDGQELDPVMFANTQALASLTRLESVSHSPILPPISLGLKDDPVLYPRPLPFRCPPVSPLMLKNGGSCPCPGGRTFYNPDSPTVKRSCRIFTLFTVYEGLIQVQACPTCPQTRRRFIGPDLREQGLFNYNNSILVSHELLDEYTFAFVTSETPFNAFVATVAHRYTVSGTEFMGDDLFRSIWFAYATRLALDNDMCCTRCGTYPETVIWDGITLAFGRKHLSSTLSPPTQTSATSIQRFNVKNHPRQQLLLDPVLRKLIRQVVNAPKLELEAASANGIREGTPSDAALAQMELDRQSSQVAEHLNRINAVHGGLRKECEPLASLFLDSYGAVAYSQKKSAPSATTRFFSPEESILQMVNGAALADLNDFMATPQPKHLTKLLSIPGLYRILKGQSSINDFVPLLQWLAKRATAVLQELSVECIPLSNGAGVGVLNSNWKVTGTFYSLPQDLPSATLR
ncbi:hypothetical protein H1R20_g9852, partial [Candolleomyces eurysporus]